MSWQMEARWTEAYEEGWWSVHVGVCVCVFQSMLSQPPAGFLTCIS